MIRECRNMFCKMKNVVSVLKIVVSLLFLPLFEYICSFSRCPLNVLGVSVKRQSIHNFLHDCFMYHSAYSQVFHGPGTQHMSLSTG